MKFCDEGSVLMKVTIEFFGPARLLTNMKEVDVDLTNGTELRDLVVFISKKFPQLLGRIVNPEPLGLIEPYAFSVNGRYVARDLNVGINEGDKILLFLIDGGG